MVSNSFLGKPHNVFKSSKKTLPVNLFKDNDRDGVPNVFDCKPNNPRKQGFIDNLFKMIKETPKRVYRDVTSKNVYSKGKTRAMSYGDYMNRRRVQLIQGTTPKYVKRRIMSQKKAIQIVLPMIPNSALPGAETAGEKKSTKGYAGRGRPRGSLDPRYAAYGGVFGYRKFVSNQKRLLRARQEQMLEQQRQQATPYEYQQYQQVPQEMTGSQQVQQTNEIPQQMQQVPQQMPVESQKRPIARVFKGNGGSPYPPVADRPLASSRETIPYGYVEVVDSFTGRRFLKKLPPSERWSGGNNA